MKRLNNSIKFLMLCFCFVIIFASKSFATEIATEQPTPDYSWYGDGSASDYILSDVNDLIGFANIVNGTAEDIIKDTFLNKNVILEKNINLTGVQWTPIGSSMYVHSPTDVKTKMFEGSFDGSNRIIKGLTAENYVPASPDVGAGEYCFGLFGYVYGASIKNVRLSKVDIIACDKEVDGKTVGGSGVAALIGYYVPADGVTSVIENCHVLSGSIKATNNMGGLIGFCETHSDSVYMDITIRKCTNAATVIAESREAAGILGLLNTQYGNTGEIKFEYCVNNGDVTVEDGANSSCAAGLLGRDNSSSVSKYFSISFERCSNTGKITAVVQEGEEVHSSGIGNVFYSSGTYMIAKNCTNLGEIIVQGEPGDIFIDEIFGYVPKRTLSTCYNLGSVTKPDEKIRVTYDSNGAEFLTAYSDIDQRKEITISNSTTPTREGYAFLGWNTKADGTGTFYKNGEKITLTDSTVFYAQWGKMNESWGVIALIDQIYTGKEIKPTIVVVDSEGEVISDGYDVVFSGNLIDVGTKNATVNYNNEVIKLDFEILEDKFPTILIEDVLVDYGEEYSIYTEAFTSAGNEILGDDIIELTYYIDSDCIIEVDNIPVNAGTYYVEGKIIGTTNYNEAFSIEPAVIQIDKITPEINVSILDWTYGEIPNEPDVIENTSDGIIDFYYKSIDGEED